MSRIVVLAALAMACGGEVGDGEPGNGSGTAHIPPELSLSFSLDRDLSVAGDSVSFDVGLTVDGAEVPVEATLRSTLEPSLAVDGGAVVATVAGDHTLYADVVWEDTAVSATAELTVTAASAEELLFVLDAPTTTAGVPVGWTTTAADRYGNTVDASGVVVNSAADVVADGTGAGTVSAEAVGTYVVSASLQGATDADELVVSAAGAETIELTVDDETPSLGQTITASVITLDAYGNDPGADYTLWVDGGADVFVWGNEITFYADGVYTVWVEVNGTQITDSVGPLVVDSTGPDLLVTEPPRAHWTTGTSQGVSGSVVDATSALVDVTVQGSSVPVDVTGAFTADSELVFGTNVIETSATDGAGNLTDDRRAVLQGEVLPYGEVAGDALMVRLYEGTGGLDTLETLGEGLIDASTLDDLIVNPVFSDESETCIDLLFTELCFTWYSVDLDVTNPTLSSTELVLDPLGDGRLFAEITVNDPAMDWSADGVVAEIPYDSSGDITADSIVVDAYLDAWVEDGQIIVAVDSVSAHSNGFYFDMDSWLYDALDFFGVDDDVSDWVEEDMLIALEDATEEEIGPLVEEVLQDLELSFDVEMGERLLTVAAIPEDIVIDDQGLSLEMGTQVTVDTWLRQEPADGSLTFPWDAPDWGTEPGVVMGMSVDMLNQLFYAVWGGGALDLEFDDEDLGLDSYLWDYILPGGGFALVVDPTLPPVVVPGSGQAPWDLQLGDLRMTLYEGAAGSSAVWIDAWVTATIELTLDSTDGTALLTELGATTLWVDVVVPDGNTAAAADTEVLLELLVPLVVPSLTDALGEFEIPAIDGFGIGNVVVDQGGDEAGYLTVGGDLVVE